MSENIDFATFRRGTAQTISANTFTVPSIGFFSFRAVINTTVYGSAAWIKVDNKNVWRFQWNAATSNYNVQIDDQILVFPGEIVTTSVENSASWQNREFIPLA